MLKRIIDTAKSLLAPDTSRSEITPPDARTQHPYREPDADELQKLCNEVQAWKDIASDEARKRGEIFAACEGLQRERDTWCELYHRQGGEHNSAQVFLGRQVEILKSMVSYSVTEINRLRIEKSLPPLVLHFGKDIEGNPLRLAEEFLVRQKQITTEARELFAEPNPNLDKSAIRTRLRLRDAWPKPDEAQGRDTEPPKTADAGSAAHEGGLQSR